MRARLEQAQSDVDVVSIRRELFEEGRDLCYVAAIESELLLILRISEGMRFNGFSVLRIADITQLEAPHPHEDFVEAALRLQGESVVDAPEIDLSCVESAIRSSGALSEIVTLHYETEDPSSCQIGKIRSVSPDTTSLVPINADAEWEDEPYELQTPSITRIDLGGEYEEALLLVGGKCPASQLRIVS